MSRSEICGESGKIVMARYTTNEDILLELKIDPVVKKIQNHRRKNIHVQSEELIMKKMVSKNI